MNLSNIYSLLKEDKIDLAEAAKRYGFTEKDLKFRITRWGDKLPQLLSTLDKLSNDVINSEEAAATLDVTIRNVNALRKSWSVGWALKDYAIVRATSKVKWDIRKKFAIDVIAGNASVDEISIQSGVSARQLRRWVIVLLTKHNPMPYGDLKLMPAHHRRALADKIDEKENLDFAKQNLLKSIADGKTAIRDEAINRVLAKRTNKSRKAPHSDQ